MTSASLPVARPAARARHRAAARTSRRPPVPWWRWLGYATSFTVVGPYVSAALHQLELEEAAET